MLLKVIAKAFQYIKVCYLHKKLTVLKILKSISNVLNVSSKFISTKSTALNVSIEGHSTDASVLRVFQSL